MRAYPPDFEMVIARDLAAALECVANGYQPFAGGTDIMVLFNAGKLTAGRFVSVRRLSELSRIQVTRESVEIGAAVTYSKLGECGDLQSEFPLLVKAAGWTGSIANQNRGTLGGNIANASPAADSGPVLLAYQAELKLTSMAGERWVPYSEFHLGYKKLAMRTGEVIACIRLPRSATPLVHYGRKVGTRQAQAIAKVSFAAVADKDRTVFRIAAGSVGPMPLRCMETERFLAGERLTKSVIEKARSIISREIAPISDLRSTREYRTRVTENLLEEFLEGLP